jgi:ATP-dependent RNA helicase DeaD
MDQFREGHINILVATDLAARGIDVKEISYVNYLPDAYESTCTVAEEQQEQEQRNFLTVLQEEEVQEIADFEKNWESNSQNLKPSALSMKKTILFYGQNKYSNQTQP